jgi:4-hydroxyphenylpyruvate dioxygenase-like putative hemolysin
MSKPTSRPQSEQPEPEKRTKLVAFYLTHTDHDALRELAHKGRFKSTSSLLTALIEPVIQGRLSLLAAVKALSRVQRFMEANGAVFKASMGDVRDGMLQLFSPPPPTIADEMLDLSQLKQDLRDLLDELENPENQPNNIKA